ncbi:MAG: MFS transporter [Bacteroidetes bacterium]|nr:MFS transporter [Bacteroidota bacterium]
MENKQESIPRYAWIVVGLLWVVAMLNYLDRLLIASMHDPIKESIAMTEAQFGLLTSVFLWVYGFLSPFGGYVADRWSRKWVIVFSVLVWSVVTFWTGTVSSFTEMLIARAIMGISEACYIPAALALITDYHKGKTRSLATGLHISGLYAGMALGGVGGFIAEYWGWRYGFHVFGAFGIIYALILMYTLKDAPTDTPETYASNISDKKVDNHQEVTLIESIKNLFSIRSFWILIFYNCILGMSFWLINAWLPTFLKEHFSLKLGEAGISATGYIQVASFVGVLVGGVLADRWARTNKRGRILIPVIGFTFGGPFLFLMASTNVFLFAIAGMVIFGLSRGFHDSNLMPILCQVVDKRFRATGYGFLNFLSTIVGGIMIYIGGVLKDANISLSLVFQISAVGILIASWTLLAVKPKCDS